MNDKKAVFAPSIDGKASGVSRSSFAVYFLRDLRAREVLNEKLLRELVGSTPSIRSSAEEILDALDDAQGAELKGQLADEIERLALDMPTMN